MARVPAPEHGQGWTKDTETGRAYAPDRGTTAGILSGQDERNIGNWTRGAGDWIGGAWNTLMGQTEYRPERQVLQVDPRDQQRQLGTRYQQTMWSDELRNRALGRGPSVAERQMGAGMGQQIQAARSAAASARGGNVGLAQRNAAMQQAQGTAGVIRDAGMLRAQEMQTAGQAYQGSLDQRRMQDLTARGMSIDEARAQLEADRESERLEQEVVVGNTERYQKGAGGAMMALGAVSDRRAKEDIQPMYSDFYSKEAPPLVPGSTPGWYQPQSQATAVPDPVYGMPAGGFGAPPGSQPSFGQQLRMALGQQTQPSQSSAQTEALERMNQMRERDDDESEVQPKKEKKESGSGGIGDMLSSFGGSLMSDRKSKEEISRLKQQIDWQNLKLRNPDIIQASESVRILPRPVRREAQMVSDYASKSIYPTPRQPDYAALDEVSAEENRRAFEDIQPVRYRYKPEAAERMANEQARTPEEWAMVVSDKRAPRNGIIAQDLEKSPAYDDTVVETPAGKAVDRDRALSETLAQAAGFDKRLKELEAYLKSDTSKRLKKQAEVTRGGTGGL